MAMSGKPPVVALKARPSTAWGGAKAVSAAPGTWLPLRIRAEGPTQVVPNFSDALTALDFLCPGNLGLRSHGSLYPRHYLNGLSALSQDRRWVEPEGLEQVLPNPRRRQRRSSVLWSGCQAQCGCDRTMPSVSGRIMVTAPVPSLSRAGKAPKNTRFDESSCEANSARSSGPVTKSTSIWRLSPPRTPITASPSSPIIVSTSDWTVGE